MEVRSKIQESVSAYFQKDHERLDALLQAYQALKRTDFLRAKERFVEFRRGLHRHIVWEEEVLFPLWERRTGMTEMGPTKVMRTEHRQIGDRLEAIHRRVAAGDPNTDAMEQELLALLRAHNRKEELVLYPDVDSMLSDEERAAAYVEIEKIPEERYHARCDRG